MNRLPKSVIVGMAVSIALNLFFIGVWSGRHFSHEERGPHGDPLGVRGFLRRSGLADADPAVKKIVHARREVIRDQVRALSTARGAVRDALETEPFDPAKLDAALAQVEARNDELQRAMHGSLAAVARAVSAEQRRRMAEALWPRPPDRHGRPVR